MQKAQLNARIGKSYPSKPKTDKQKYKKVSDADIEHCIHCKEDVLVNEYNFCTQCGNIVNL